VRHRDDEMMNWGSSVGTLGKWSKIDFKAVRHSHPVGQSCLFLLSCSICCTSEPSRSTSVPYIWESEKLWIECLSWMLSCHFLTFPAACSTLLLFSLTVFSARLLCTPELHQASAVLVLRLYGELRESLFESTMKLIGMLFCLKGLMLS